MCKLFSVLSLVLLYAVIIFGQPNIDIPITASDGIGSNNQLAIGLDTSATNGIDFDLGESDLPPFPPGGVFEARFDLTPYAGEPLSSYKDYRNAPSLPYVGVTEHKLVWQLSDGATEFQISYSMPPEASMTIKDPFGGILFESGTLTGTGTYSVPTPYINVFSVIITLTIGEPVPILVPSNPNPPDLQTNVPITGVSLGWVNGPETENVEIWFGPNGRVLKLYDGAAVNTWSLGNLNYNTQYSWFIVCKNSTTGVQGPTWTFTTLQDTNVVIDSIIVFPQNLNNWTGSCNISNKTQVSLVNGFNAEVGWMVFDITAIPNNVTINSVIFNGYLFDNSWPYWSITPMGNVNPVTDAASAIFNQISTHSGQGIAYSYNEESGTLQNGWLTRTLGSTVSLDLQSSLSKNWFAIGIVDFDFSTNYYVKFHGWAEANKPYLKIIYSFRGETTFQFQTIVDNGWNLVSIPGLLPDGNQNINNWWQYRDPAASVFEYNGFGYISVNQVAPGTGYWMKHLGLNLYDTGDEWPAGGLRIVRHDPINVHTGWNIFGIYEEIVPASGLTTIPSGLISSPVYGYSGGYFIPTQLVPGRGYWTKLTSDAQIIIPDASLKSTNAATEWFKEDWGRIIFTDASGINYTLYAVNGQVDLSQYELPPAPPAGMFDIRYGSGRIAEDINSAIQTIELNGVTYPVTVRVENMDIRLMDETGKGVNVNLKSGEEVVISDGTIQKLKVSGELLPTVYSLEQNYPNPFNPSTVIEFSLPEDVSNVKLSIYNALGEKVAELVNSSLTAGKYQYQWNAQNVATGMYIYELRTDKFVSVKKMLLLK
jgi:hypothetical protein